MSWRTWLSRKWRPSTSRRRQLREQLERLRGVWPRVAGQAAAPIDAASPKCATMLRDAGCPYEPEQIGISREAACEHSYRQALFIRRRFTVLDLAHRAGLFEDCLTDLFGPAGLVAMSQCRKSR